MGTSYHVSSITDGLGNQTSFSYNLLSNTTTVTDPLKNVTTYSYDATTGHLLSVSQTDENSQPATTTYTYDSNNNITKVVDAAGRATYYTYDADGNNTEIQDSLGNTVTRTFDAADHLASQTVYTTSAPAVGQAASNPETTHYLYDGSENLVFTVSPLGEVTQYLYDSEGDRISAIRYPAVTYKGTTFTTAALSGWASSQDQTKIQRTDTGYDLTGQIQTVTVWNSTASGTGAGVNDGIQSTIKRLIVSMMPRGS